MRVTTPADLRAVLDTPAPRGWVRGLLPSDLAPAGAVVWVGPYTVGQSCLAVDQQRLALRGRYEDAAGDAAILADAIRVDPDAWCPDGEPPVPAETVPLFDGPCPLDPYGAGLPLLMALLQATGYQEVPPLPAPATLAETRERARGRGRWVAGLFPQDPSAELWVAPYSEADRATAQDQATIDLGSDGAPVRIASVASMRKWLCLAAVRTGPGGDRLLTPETAALLPFGAAVAIELIATQLTLGDSLGASPAVRFLAAAGADAGPGAGGRAGMVGSGEASPPAVRGDGQSGRPETDDGSMGAGSGPAE